MLKLVRTCVLPVFVLVLTLVASPVMAQNAPTWMPAPDQFDKARHCYLAPELSGRVDLADCEQRLKDAGQVHGYQFYFIVTVRGNEPKPNTKQKFAAWKLDRYAPDVASKMPADKYVLILLVRDQQNPNSRSLAAQGGDELQKLGLKDDYFNGANGPLERCNSIYLPNNPAGFAIAVADDVNNATDKIFADRKQREEAARRQAEEAKRQAEQQAAHDRQVKTTWTVISIVVPLGIAGLVVLVLFLRRQQWKGKAEQLVAELRSKLDSSNSFYKMLKSSFGEFLDDRKNWRSAFDPKGETYPAYEKAISAYSEFSIRTLTASKLLTEADDLIKRAPAWTFWTVADYAQVVDLLTTKDVEVTGEEVELTEVRNIHGGTLKKSVYKPDTLLASSNEMFNEANDGLRAIFNALKNSDKNKVDIEKLLTKVDGTKTKLTGAGLVFDPYQSRYDGLQKRQQAVLAIINSDPLKALAGTQEVESAIEALEQDLEQAVDFKQVLDSQTKSVVEQAATAIDKARNQPFSYNYPLAKDESAPANLAQAKLSISEQGSNPDTLLSQARQQLADAYTALLKADMPVAAKQKAAAEQSAAQVQPLIELVLYTKLRIEKLVPEVRASAAKLVAGLPAAAKSLEALKADFLAGNFVGEPEKVTSARSLSDSVAGELAEVKKKYESQQFTACLEQVKLLGARTTQASIKLEEVSARLETLRGLRQHSRSTVDACAKLAETLTDSIKINGFTTSAEVDATFARLTHTLGQQQANMREHATDWPAAATAADTLLGQFQKVAGDVEAQKAAHTKAESSMRALKAAVNSAAGYARDNATLQPAKDSLKTAQESLADLEKRMAQPKSDWAALDGYVLKATNLAQTAEQHARADKVAFDQASDNLRELKAAIAAAQNQVHEHITSQAAADQLNQAQMTLTAVQKELAGKPTSSWSPIAERAKQACAAANAASAQAQLDLRNYSEAVSTTRTLSTALNNAELATNDNATRQPALDKLSQAKCGFADAQAQLRRARSDWAHVTSAARQAITLAEQAVELAQADRRAYDYAVATIGSATQKLRGAQRHYDRGVTADLSPANRQLSSARAALNEGRYEEASQYAGSLDSTIAEAARLAAAAVAAILAAEAEREAAARREQAERESALQRQQAREEALRQEAQEESRRQESGQEYDRQETVVPRDNEPASRTSDPDSRSSESEQQTGRSGSGTCDF